MDVLREGPAPPRSADDQRRIGRGVRTATVDGVEPTNVIPSCLRGALIRAPLSTAVDADVEHAVEAYTEAAVGVRRAASAYGLGLPERALQRLAGRILAEPTPGEDAMAHFSLLQTWTPASNVCRSTAPGRPGG